MPARRWINTDVDGAGASAAPEPGEMSRLIPTGDAPEAGGDALGKAATWGELGKMDLSQCPLCLSSLGKEKPKDSGDISLWI